MLVPEVVAAILIAALSFAFELIPGLVDVWDKLDTKWKPLAFFVLSVVVAFAVPLLACMEINVGVDAVCPTVNGQFIADTIFVAIAAWMAVTASFGYIQDPVGKRIKNKEAVKAYIKTSSTQPKG